jgi:hypothetical protein
MLTPDREQHEKSKRGRLHKIDAGGFVESPAFWVFAGPAASLSIIRSAFDYDLKMEEKLQWRKIQME